MRRLFGKGFSIRASLSSSFFVVRYRPIRRAFQDTRLSMVFAVPLCSYLRKLRPCGSPVPGVWPTRARELLP
jgi:hypothetical protein